MFCVKTVQKSEGAKCKKHMCSTCLKFIYIIENIEMIYKKFPAMLTHYPAVLPKLHLQMLMGLHGAPRSNGHGRV